MRQDVGASSLGVSYRHLHPNNPIWHRVPHVPPCASHCSLISFQTKPHRCKSWKKHSGLGRRNCRAEAASLPLVGGFSSMASANSSSGSADQSSSSQQPTEQMYRPSIDPQASGQDITVVSTYRKFKGKQTEGSLYISALGLHLFSTWT